MVVWQRFKAVGPVVVIAAALCLGTRTAAADAATLPTPAISFSAPASAIVGGAGYALAATTDSDQPVTFAVDPAASNAACSIANDIVTFAHAGSCVIDAQTGADADFSAASATQTITVAAAATTTGLVVGTGSLTATVAAVAPGGGIPSGDIVFSVEGRVLGSATLVNGVATLSYSTPPNVTETILASFGGDGDYTASSAAVTVNGPDIEPTFVAKPTIAAVLTSNAPRNSSGWFHTRVRVHFICNGAGSQVLGGCPPTAVLDRSGADLTLSRTIHTTSGNEATVTLRGIKIDLTKPRVQIVGARNHALSHGGRPLVSCSASDQVSGIKSCRLQTTVKRTSTAETIICTATAISWAGVAERTATTFTARV
jgi:hypothetical protein